MKILYKSRLGLAIVAATLASPGLHAATQSDWGFSFTPYIWGAGISGNIENRNSDSGGGGSSGQVVDIEFDDYELNAAFMGTLEVRYQNFGWFWDTIYLDISGDAKVVSLPEVPLLKQLGIATDLSAAVNTLGVDYRFPHPTGYFDILLGWRFYSLEPTLNLSLPSLPRLDTASITAKADWDEVVLGIKSRYGFGQNWSMIGYADIATGPDSDSYQLYGGLAYHFNPTFNVNLGYRYLAFEYEGDVNRYDLQFAGPMLGLGMTF
jgi:outer membrane receptor protein involved in Fe transport